jgi:hypothetical protein
MKAVMVLQVALAWRRNGGIGALQVFVAPAENRSDRTSILAVAGAANQGLDRGLPSSSSAAFVSALQPHDAAYRLGSGACFR